MLNGGECADVWECDGCAFTGTEAEVEAHVIEAGSYADGTLMDDDDVVCWGGMEVGGGAWFDYHAEGRQPMQNIVDQVRDLAEGETEAKTRLSGGDERRVSPADRTCPGVTR